MELTNRDLEKKVVGQMAIGLNSAILGLEILNENCFTTSDTKDLFKCVKSLYLKSGNLDMVVLMEEYKNLGYSDINFINITSSGGVQSIEKAALVLKQYELKREIFQFNQLLTAKLQSENDSLELLDYVNNGVKDLNNLIDKSNKRNISDITTEFIEDIKEAIENKGSTSLKTGLKEMDYQTGGYKGGQLIISAGRPGMGKSTEAFTTAYNIAKNGGRVVLFTLEMMDTEVVAKFIANNTDINILRMEDGSLSVDEFEEIGKAKDYIDTLDLNIFKMSSPTLEDISVACKKLNNEKPIDLIIIDYLQLMGGEGDEYKLVSRNSKGLKQLAMQLSVPIQALAQLNRSVETRVGSKRPNLSDLRGSGSIEEDADKVIFWYRPEYYGMDEDENGECMKNKVISIVAKNRGGKVGDRMLGVEFQYGRFTNLEPDFDAEFPNPIQPNNEEPIF